MIQFRCGTCGLTKSVSEGLAGKRIKCPKCSQVSRIEAPKTSEEKPLEPQASANPVVSVVSTPAQIIRGLKIAYWCWVAACVLVAPCVAVVYTHLITCILEGSFNTNTLNKSGKLMLEISPVLAGLWLFFFGWMLRGCWWAVYLSNNPAHVKQGASGSPVSFDGWWILRALSWNLCIRILNEEVDRRGIEERPISRTLRIWARVLNLSLFVPLLNIFTSIAVVILDALLYRSVTRVAIALLTASETQEGSGVNAGGKLRTNQAQAVARAVRPRD